MGAIGGAVLLGIAAAAAEGQDDQLGAIGAGVLLMGSGLVVLTGAACLVAAAGVWMRQAWAWLVGVAATAVIAAGAAGSWLSGNREPSLVVAVLAGAAGAAALWWPDTRRVCRI
ncbi:MAG: hypothetical protein U0869_20030 [Chloroflexota bacterium]